MMELPEACVIAAQLACVKGRTIQKVIANQSPHGFAWFTGDPAAYPGLMEGKTLGDAWASPNAVEIAVGDALKLVISTALRLYPKGAKLPPRHQLLLELDDGSSLVCTVQMWGAMNCLPMDEQPHSPHDEKAAKQPSALGEDFTWEFFEKLWDDAPPKTCTKALLATEQRIPGLGNGCAQDILWTARLHPKRLLQTLQKDDCRRLYESTKTILAQMAAQGGRDVEKDLFGQSGGYKTIMSKKTVGTSCPICGMPIERMAFLGGNVYVCNTCQPLK